MITATSICEDIRDAISQFGTYNYFDKLADETVEIHDAELRQLPAVEVAAILLEVLKQEPEYGQHTISAYLAALDNVSDDYWNELMSHKELEECY